MKKLNSKQHTQKADRPLKYSGSGAGDTDKHQLFTAY